MNISPTTSSSGLVSDVSAGQLGKQEFLELLVAQIANQDPLEPLEDKEFIAQLAQFSALEQQMAANEQLEILGITQTALVNGQVTSLVGKYVTVGDGSVQGIIESVTFESGAPELVVGGERVRPADILTVGAAPPNASSSSTDDQNP